MSSFTALITLLTVAVTLVSYASAVTPSTSTPTADANYMVLQGEVEYLNNRGVDHGTISGHIQLVRSALSATSSFSFTVQFADTALAPADGSTITGVVARHICSVVDTSSSATPYQDPESCPGYSAASNDNSCSAGDVTLNPDLEARFTCTVQTVLSARVCTGSLDWSVYIPEYFDDQNLEDLSLVLSSSSGEFACGNFDEVRELVVTGAQSGTVEKDELGYTYMDVSVTSLSPSTSYTAFVSSSPCDSADGTFAGPQLVTGLTQDFTTDSSGEASSVTAVISSIASAATLSVVISQSGGFPVRCFDLDMPAYAGSGRNGQIPAAQPGESTTSSSYANGGGATYIDACEVWAPFYSNDEADAYGMGKGKGKKGSKSSKGNIPSFSNFASTTIAYESRCCLTSSYNANDQKGRKSRMGRLVAGITSKEFASKSGTYAGVAGACVLAVAVAMHIRRRSGSAVEPDESVQPLVTERTPLTKS